MAIRVRCMWLKLNCLNSSPMQSPRCSPHDHARGLSGNGRVSQQNPSADKPHNPASFPEQAADQWRKRTKGEPHMHRISVQLKTQDYLSRELETARPCMVTESPRYPTCML